MFIGKYNKSVILTYVGVCFAILGIFFVSDINNLLICLIIAGVCDLFDGAVARRMKRDREDALYGIQIDSLADMVSFIFLPIVILVNISHNNILDFFISCFYVLCGLSRLAYFNISAIQKENNPIKFFTGLPVTYVSIIIPISYLVFGHKFKDLYPYLILIIAILFILKIKIPKPTKKSYMFFIILAIVLIILLRGVS